MDQEPILIYQLLVCSKHFVFWLIILSVQYHHHPIPTIFWRLPFLLLRTSPCQLHQQSHHKSLHVNTEWLQLLGCIVGCRNRPLAQAKPKTCLRKLGIQTRRSKLSLVVLLSWENISLGAAIGKPSLPSWRLANEESWSAAERNKPAEREAQRCELKCSPEALGVPDFNSLGRVSCTSLLEF